MLFHWPMSIQHARCSRMIGQSEVAARSGGNHMPQEVGDSFKLQARTLACLHHLCVCVPKCCIQDASTTKQKLSILQNMFFSKIMQVFFCFLFFVFFFFWTETSKGHKLGEKVLRGVWSPKSLIWTCALWEER